MELKQLKLEQLKAMKDELTHFIDIFEKGKVVILEGRMTNEMMTGSAEERPTNELYINIEYIKYY